MLSRSLTGMLPDDSPWLDSLEQMQVFLQIMSGYDYNGTPPKFYSASSRDSSVGCGRLYGIREAVISRARPQARRGA